MTSKTTKLISRFQYVRTYEEASDPILLKNCYIAVRIDGQHFHRFSKNHNFYKPNDKRALDLMVKAAKNVMSSFYPSIKIAYGQSDEFSFIFSKSSDLFKRRANKLISLVVSTFTSSYVYHWSDYMKPVNLQYPPAFDGRCIIYPSSTEIIDYLKWRQDDCHINNLFNTTFYCLTGEYTSFKINDKEETVLIDRKSSLPPPMTHQEAQIRLKGTDSSDKQEIMFSQYGVNYNNEMEQFKKGSFLILDHDKNHEQGEEIKIKCLHMYIGNSSFWQDNNYLLE